MAAPPTVSFLGAIDTVTGSRYLLRGSGARVLVDCGLFQGPKKLRERNWLPPGVDVATLDAVILTHAHIDHSGYLPRLCKLGYTAPVYCTGEAAHVLARNEVLRVKVPVVPFSLASAMRWRGSSGGRIARSYQDCGFAFSTPEGMLFSVRTRR